MSRAVVYVVGSGGLAYIPCCKSSCFLPFHLILFWELHYVYSAIRSLLFLIIMQHSQCVPITLLILPFKRNIYLAALGLRGSTPIFIASFGLSVVVCRLQFPNQGLNSAPLHWELSLTHQTTREVPIPPFDQLQGCTQSSPPINDPTGNMSSFQSPC